MEQTTQQAAEHMQFIINLLIGVVGILIGIGVAHVGILRKLNKVVVSVARHDERIVTLFANDGDRKKENDRVLALQSDLVGTMQELISQNTQLIRNPDRRG